MMTSLRRMTLQVLTAAVLVTSSLAVGLGGNVVQFHQDLGTHHKQQTHFRPHDPNTGYVGNCKGGYYDISWTPKNVSPASRVEMKANFVSPITLDKIRIVGSLMYEQTQMLAIDRVFSCEELAQNVDYLFPHEVNLKCPINKGQILSASFLYTDTETLIGIDGNFQLKATIYDLTSKEKKTKYDSEGHDFFCVEINMTILPFGDSY